jgi:2-polyprenyl-3-methyl-5-hydroxy-6-metoxy-1,4-benzoquinol methylase
VNRFQPYRAQSPCNLCGGTEGVLIQNVDRHGEPLAVTCCTRCGLAYVDPLPTADELCDFYARRYRAEYKKAIEPRLKHVYRAGRVALERLRRLAPHVAPPARTLDCGAGGGEFVYLLASCGYRASGIEPNDGYREHACRQYGVDLRPGTVDTAEFPDAEFDLITVFHALEHFRDPAGGLRRLARWLKPGGMLCVEVPNALTLVSSPSNLYHRAHLFYFAAEPLGRLAGLCGLEAVRVEGDPSLANLTALFRRVDQHATAALDASTHQAVVETNRRRTLPRYLLRASTASGLVRRIVSRTREARIERAGRSARETLDQLYAAELGASRRASCETTPA